MFISDPERDEEDRHMIYLIIGTPDSGKSKLAEDLVLSISGNKARCYIATMIPYGVEGDLRVSKHRRMREGKDFTTFEKPFDICETEIPSDSIVLLECVSNLAANELFERHTHEDKCEEKLISDILALADSADDIIIVTNHFDITDDFDEETIRYACLMERLNSRLSKAADKVIDLTKK